MQGCPREDCYPETQIHRVFCWETRTASVRLVGGDGRLCQSGDRMAVVVGQSNTNDVMTIYR